MAWTCTKIAGSIGWDTAGTELVWMDGAQLSGGGWTKLPKLIHWSPKEKCCDATSLEGGLGGGGMWFSREA